MSIYGQNKENWAILICLIILIILRSQEDVCIILKNPVRSVEVVCWGCMVCVVCNINLSSDHYCYCRHNTMRRTLNSANGKNISIVSYILAVLAVLFSYIYKHQRLASSGLVWVCDCMWCVVCGVWCVVCE